MHCSVGTGDCWVEDRWWGIGDRKRIVIVEVVGENGSGTGHSW